jgi:hypothetical protein
MFDRISHGVELTLRSSALALLLGLRWAGVRNVPERSGIPTPRWGLGLLSKIALDELFFATELIGAPFIAPDARRRLAGELSKALEIYEERGWLNDPASYHVRPPSLEPESLEQSQSHGFYYQHLRYESGYEPHAGEPGRERWLGYTPNRTAHARLLEHPGAPRPWLVCVPGYRMGHPAIDFTGFPVRWLHRILGLNLAIPILPLHGPRSIGRKGGDGFLTGDFVDTVHAQTQAVWDVRRLIAWLGEKGAPALGVYGVSLGGCTSALLASLEKDLHCVIAGIPAVDFVRLLQAHAPKFVLGAAEWIGLSLKKVERLLRVVSPLALSPQVPRERRYLYAGLADRLAAPDHARDLWNHWEQPRVVWYEGSHISFLWESEVRALLHEALSTCGFLIPRLQA